MSERAEFTDKNPYNSVKSRSINFQSSTTINKMRAPPPVPKKSPKPPPKPPKTVDSNTQQTLNYSQSVSNNLFPISDISLSSPPVPSTPRPAPPPLTRRKVLDNPNNMVNLPSDLPPPPPTYTRSNILSPAPPPPPPQPIQSTITVRSIPAPHTSQICSKPDSYQNFKKMNETQNRTVEEEKATIDDPPPPVIPPRRKTDRSSMESENKNITFKSSNSISDERFRFSAEFPLPDKMSNKQKTYPSQNKSKDIKNTSLTNNPKNTTPTTYDINDRYTPPPPISGIPAPPSSSISRTRSIDSNASLPPPPPPYQSVPSSRIYDVPPPPPPR